MSKCALSAFVRFRVIPASDLDSTIENGVSVPKALGAFPVRSRCAACCCGCMLSAGLVSWSTQYICRALEVTRNTHHGHLCRHGEIMSRRVPHLALLVTCACCPPKMRSCARCPGTPAMP